MTLTIDHDRATRILWQAVAVAMLCWIASLGAACLVAYQVGYASGLYDGAQVVE